MMDQLNKQWIKQFGSSSWDALNFSISDGKGGVFVVGDTNGSIYGQNSIGGSDVFIANFNNNGDLVWARQFGSYDNEYVNSIIPDGKGGIFLVGGTTGSINGQSYKGGADVFIANYSGNGDELWLKQFGSDSYDYASSIISDDKGGVFVTGFTSGSINGQNFSGGSDVFIANYNGSGDETWTKQIGSDSWDNPSNAISDGKGGIFVAGSTSGSINGQSFNGGSDVFIANYNGSGDEVWLKQLGSSGNDYVNSIVPDGEGGTFVFGGTYGSINGQTSNGDSDVFIAHYNGSGDEAWARQIGSDTYDYTTSSISDGKGGIIVVGGTGGSINGQISNGEGDVFVANYNSSGDEVWTSQFGSNSYDCATSVISDGKGGVFVAGQTGGSLSGQTGNGQSDVFIANYSGSGDEIWTKQIGSDSYDFPNWSPNALVADGNSGVFVTGITYGSIDGLTSNGGADVFIANYSGTGDEVWTNQIGSDLYDFSNSVISDGTGSIFVTGITYGSIDGQIGNGGVDGFVAKFGSIVSLPIIGSDGDNSITITGTGSGIADGSAFSNIQSIDLKGGDDTATIGTAGTLAGLLNGGTGTDLLNLNDGANAFSIKGDGTGAANGTGTDTTNQTQTSSFEVVNLLGGDDKATVDLMNPATAARSLTLNGGDGNDALDIKLTDQEFADLQGTDALMRLGAYLDDPTGKTLDIAFGDFSLSASGFESATFNHVIPHEDQPPEAPTLSTVSASASDTASASGLEGLNLDVGGVANVQAPVILKSTSDASTVEGNVKSDAHATEVLGISVSTLHAASDLSVGSALQSIVTGSAESTSGIAIANALVDTQHGIDLTNPTGGDALASGGSSTIVSTSTLTATSTAQNVGDGSSDSGARHLDGAWSTTIAQDHLGLGSTGILTLDSESNATVSTSMLSKLTSTATANDGLAVASSQLLSSTGIENLNAEVGGLGLVTAINQGVFKADAISTTEDASAMGINKASAGILDSTFSFGVTDSTITAKDFNTAQISATSTGGDAWSKLQSSSIGLADLTGTHSITDAGAISAIASDQGFAHSATVSGSSTAFASQEAMGMGGYVVHNHSDLTLSAQAMVTSEANSSAVGG